MNRDKSGVDKVCPEPSDRSPFDKLRVNGRGTGRVHRLTGKRLNQNQENNFHGSRVPFGLGTLVRKLKKTVMLKPIQHLTYWSNMVRS